MPGSNYEGTNSQIEKISLDVMGSDSYPNEGGCEKIRHSIANLLLTKICLVSRAATHYLTYFSIIKGE